MAAQFSLFRHAIAADLSQLIGFTRFSRVDPLATWMTGSNDGESPESEPPQPILAGVRGCGISATESLFSGSLKIDQYSGAARPEGSLKVRRDWEHAQISLARGLGNRRDRSTDRNCSLVGSGLPCNA